jgi:hypothetical protein
MGRFAIDMAVPADVGKAWQGAPRNDHGPAVLRVSVWSVVSVRAWGGGPNAPIWPRTKERRPLADFGLVATWRGRINAREAGN